MNLAESLWDFERKGGKESLEWCLSSIREKVNFWGVANAGVVAMGKNRTGVKLQGNRDINTQRGRKSIVPKFVGSQKFLYGRHARSSGKRMRIHSTPPFNTSFHRTIPNSSREFSVTIFFFLDRKSVV